MFGVVDFTPVHQAAWFALPNFTFPEFNINAILFMIPVAIAPAVEHVGDMLAISNVTGKDYLKKNQGCTAPSQATVLQQWPLLSLVHHQIQHTVK